MLRYYIIAVNVTMVFKVKSGGIVLKSIDKEWGTVQLSSDGNENLLRRNEEEGFHVIVKMVSFIFHHVISKVRKFVLITSIVTN